jgi:hypothetical protein
MESWVTLAIFIIIVLFFKNRKKKIPARAKITPALEIECIAFYDLKIHVNGKHLIDLSLGDIIKKDDPVFLHGRITDTEYDVILDLSNHVDINDNSFEVDIECVEHGKSINAIKLNSRLEVEYVCSYYDKGKFIDSFEVMEKRAVMSNGKIDTIVFDGVRPILRQKDQKRRRK